MFDHYYYNRPVSPHLSIYSMQMFSLLSILHRFSAIFLTFFLVFLIFYLNLMHNLSFTNTDWFDYIFNIKYLYIYIYVFFILNIVFHSINGLRYILFSLNIYLNWKFMFIIFWISIIINLYLIIKCF